MNEADTSIQIVEILIQVLTIWVLVFVVSLSNDTAKTRVHIVHTYIETSTICIETSASYIAAPFTYGIVLLTYTLKTLRKFSSAYTFIQITEVCTYQL